jgi:hypothetical protein
MLNLLSTLFRGSQPPRPGFPLMSAPAPADVCGVAYRRELTLELTREQARLRSQFERVAQAFRENDRPSCIGRLCEFDRDLRVYLAFEGVRFESYMRYVLSDDAENLKLMHRLRARLRGLAHYVHTIVETDEDGDLQEQGYQTFGAAIERVGAGLKQVFECQQTLLFPLYRPLSSH